MPRLVKRKKQRKGQTTTPVAPTTDQTEEREVPKKPRKIKVLAGQRQRKTPARISVKIDHGRSRKTVGVLSTDNDLW